MTINYNNINYNIDKNYIDKNYIKNNINKIINNNSSNNSNLVCLLEKYQKKEKELLKHVKELENMTHELEKSLEEQHCVGIEDYTCNICMDSKKTHAFNMCGHLCVCKNCGDKCVRCPLCRTEGQLIKIIM